MVDVGLKQPASGGFVSDSFGVFSCQGGGVFIPETYISAASIRQLSELMNNKTKEAIDKIVKQSPTTTIRTGVRYDDRKQSVCAQSETSDAGKVLEQLNEEFSKSTKGSTMAQTIRINTAVDNGGLEEFKRQVESEFCQLQASITTIQEAVANSDKAFTESLRQMAIDMQRNNSGFA
ncbi:MAG: hypothetical protein PV362_16620 [Providencia heimbachae]|nr:hypothetical protein [Providencia heimbachae]